MECPHCHSKKTQKFGSVKGKQRYRCQKCNRYFQSHYEQQGYSSDVREICLKMYLNGMGFRGIERITPNSSYYHYELGKRIRVRIARG